jgi:hypothetical protein
MMALQEGNVERIERRIATLSELSRRFSLLRLGLLVGGVVAVYLAFSLAGDGIGWPTLIVVLAAFGFVAWRHSLVEKSIRRFRLWREIRLVHIARKRHDWEHIPSPPSISTEDTHPFEIDLNISGERSLLHLIDTARSMGGSRRLHSWLIELIPDPVRTLRRQQLVRELEPLDHFRDRLALVGMMVTPKSRVRWEGEGINEWLGSASRQGRIRPVLILLVLLACLNITLWILTIVAALPAIWPWTLGLYALIYLNRGRDFAHLFEEAFELDLRLGELRAILLYLERYRYHHVPGLARLCAPFTDASSRPSSHLRAISRIAGAASFQHNPLARLLLNIVVPWDLFFAWRLELTKERLQTMVPVWIDIWYELDALSSLANLGSMESVRCYPEIISDPASRPLLHIREAGHPLIPQSSRVANDLTIERVGEIAIVTGSNMSGKSTFLRTLGINLALAWAGGPVCAAGFTTVPMRLFTCINVSDSVNDGISYFYAEVRRLKALLLALQLDHPYPLFFLIDEIFRGTNNRERLIGSRSYVKALAGGHGIGLISTHDLELVHLAEESPSITNYHFREHVIDDRMVFDYRLRSGPSPTTNALAIMRIEGLPVEQF